MLPSVSKEIVPNHSERPLKIVRFSTRETVNNLTIQQWFLGNGITVLHIGLEYQNSRDLVVVDGPCLQALAQTTDDFTIEDVNPTKPSGGERNSFGISEATKRALQRFLKNALQVIFHTKDGCAASFYRAIARRNGLIARLEMLEFCFEFKVTLPTKPFRRSH